jgi:NCS2 family nucleobase:cation symporter-2
MISPIPFPSMQAQGDSWSVAYGRMLGTTAICAITPIILSFIPFRLLKRIFPPVVTSVTIMLIGIHLTSVGMKNWGGGANCYPPKEGGVCMGNGFVKLPFGNAEYVGMGFLVFASIIAFEIFGSPFMRNGSVFLALILGCVCVRKGFHWMLLRNAPSMIYTAGLSE